MVTLTLVVALVVIDEQFKNDTLVVALVTLTHEWTAHEVTVTFTKEVPLVAGLVELLEALFAVPLTVTVTHEQL